MANSTINVNPFDVGEGTSSAAPNNPTIKVSDTILLDVPLHERSVILNTTNPLIRDALILNFQKRQHLSNLKNKIVLYLTKLQKQKPKRKILCKKRKRLTLEPPYFKDEGGYPCPMNEEYKQRIKSGEILLHTLTNTEVWFRNDQLKLVYEVIQQIIKLKKSDLNKILGQTVDDKLKHEIISHRIKVLQNDSVIENIIANWFTLPYLKEVRENARNVILTEINRIEEEIINDESEKHILWQKLQKLQHELEICEAKYIIIQTICDFSGKIDWLEISATNFDLNKTDVECRSMWQLYLHPNLNKTKWTKTQEKLLEVVVENHRYENWDAISHQLNLNRSAYQCCVHFQANLRTKFSANKWTEEEDQTIMSLINEHKLISNYIPWGKLAFHIGNRSKKQIYQHYRYCLRPNMKKGRFSVAENILFQVCYNIFEDVSKVSEHFPDRTPLQIRDRMRSLKGSKMCNWTTEEDVRVMEHVSEHGEMDWAKTGLNRNSASVRHRYSTLKKWIVQNPGEAIENAPRRSYTRSKSNWTLSSNLVNSYAKRILKDFKDNKITTSDLSIDFVNQILQKKGVFIKESKKRKKTKVENTVDEMLLLFFESTYKFPGRKKEIIDNKLIDSTTDTIGRIFNVLGAKVKFPDRKTLETHPFLDEFDVMFIKKYKEITNTVNSSSVADVETPKDTKLTKTSEIASTSKCCISVVSIDSLRSQKVEKTPEKVERSLIPGVSINLPPNLGNVIGLRGLLLHRGNLINQAANDKSATTIHWSYKFALQVNKHLNTGLSKLSSNDRSLVVHQQELFYERFKRLFKWPSYLTFQYNMPSANNMSEDTSENILNEIFAKYGTPNKVLESIAVKRALESDLSNKDAKRTKFAK